MEAFHFGPGNRPLFGMRHVPPAAARDTAVLICPPWGAEYMRSHRGLRMLAERLATAGYDSLRFDYSGTGDSEGNSLDARLPDWLTDIAQAAQELRDLSGAHKVAVIGVRLGALLASEAVRQGMRCEALLYWDAPENGAAFAESMLAMDAALDAEKNYKRSRATRLKPSANERCGHAWHKALAHAITALPAASEHEASKVLWLHSADHAEGISEPALRLADPAHWGQPSWNYSPWLPSRNIEQLVQQLLQWLP